MSWFVLTIAAVFCLSIFLFLTKKLLNNNYDPFVYGGLMQLTTGILGTALLPGQRFMFVVNSQNLLLLFLTGVVYAVAATIYYYALTHIDLSEFGILETTSMVWGLLLGLLLFGEPVTSIKLIAMLGILFAIFLITYTRNFSYSKSKYKILVICSTLFYTVGGALDKYLTGQSNPASYLVLSFLTAGSVMSLVHVRRIWKQKHQLLTSPRFITQLIINSTFVVLAYTFQFRAYQIGGELSKIFIILQTQTILVTILGIVFLHETQNIPKKIVAITVAFAGVLLLAI